jgi:hypothetical protein
MPACLKFCLFTAAFSEEVWTRGHLAYHSDDPRPHRSHGKSRALCIAISLFSLIAVVNSCHQGKFATEAREGNEVCAFDFWLV